jgi:uncharacterized protein YjdB
MRGGSGTGLFSKIRSGLTSNSNYTFKAYAINDTDTSYGSAISFTTFAITSTDAASSVLSDRATLGGTITAEGNATVSERGVCYSLATNNTDPEIGGTGVTKETNGTGTGSFDEIISSLTDGVQYYFKAYATNPEGTSYGSAFNFTTLKNAPSTQATNIAFSNIQTNQLTATASGGNGDYRLIIAKEGASVSVVPVDGTEYTGTSSFGTGQQIGSGNYVVSAGSGSNVTITNLSEDTRYYFKVFEYNNTNGDIAYKTDGFSAGNPTDTITTKSAPSTQASDLIFSDILNEGLTIDWTRGDGDSVMIVAKAGSTLTETPTPGSAYSPDANFIDGDPLGGGYVVYTGIGETVTVTGLTASSEYTFKAFEFNNQEPFTSYMNSGGTDNPASQYTVGTEPSVQANDIEFSNIQAGEVTLSWTPGTGGGNRLVLAHEGAAVDSAPIDGFAYSTNSIYSTGDEIGLGNYVVYNSNGTGVTVSNLLPETTYHFKVFEYSGTGIAVNYKSEDGVLNNPNDITTSVGEPLSQVDMLSISNLTPQTLTLNWLRGSGDSVLIVAKAGSTLSATPTDETHYDTSAVFGSGNTIATGVYAIYKGTGTSVNITGLTAGMEYTFKAFEYNSISDNPNYQDADATDNPLSRYTLAVEPSPQATDIVFSNIEATQLQLDWTKGTASGTNWLVLASTSDIGSTSPTDGVGYTADADFGNGDPISSCYVVYNGASNSAAITNFLPNTSYYFKVFEYTGTNTSSNYIIGDGASGNPNDTITPLAEPTVQAGSISFTNIAEDTYTVNWDRGDAGYTGVIVLAKLGGAIPANAYPADGTTYIANADFGNGASLISDETYVVFNGTGTSENITALTAGNEYHFRAFEYNNSGDFINYFTATANDNPNSQYTFATEPTDPPTSFTVSTFDANNITLGWTAGTGGSGRIILARESAAVNTIPIDEQTYAASATFGSGDVINSDNYVVYAGSGTSVEVTGLLSETTYHFQIFEYNNDAINYLTSSAPTVNQTTSANSAPTVQDSLITFTSINTSSFTINWINGNGDKRIVAMKEATTGSPTPTDNSTYIASNNWSSKTGLISNDFYTVYNGTDETVTVTNLSPNTTYRVQIFGYNNLSGSEKYLTTTPTDNPNNQNTLKVAPSMQAANIAYVTQYSNSLEIDWDNGNGDNRICVINTIQSFSDYNGTDPTASTVYGSGEQVVLNGTANTVTITGLTGGTPYYFKVLEYNNSGSGTLYHSLSDTTDNPASISTLGIATWEGTSTNWEDASNWSSVSFPTSNQSVNISGGQSAYPILIASYTIDNLTIAAGASITINDGYTLTVNGDALLESPTNSGMPGTIVNKNTTGGLAVTGTSTIERYMPTSNSHFYSSAVSPVVVSDFSYYWVGEYDEPNITWSYLTAASSMSVLKGYEILKSTNPSLPDMLSFTGSFNNGNKSTSVSNNSPGDESYGWNLVGNPYPSTIDVLASGLTLTNIDATIYEYTGATYTSYNVSTEAGDGSQYIAPMQGFFVHATASSGTFGVANSLRVAQPSNFKSALDSKQIVKLNVSSDVYSSTTSIVFFEGATELFDSQFDGYKLLGYNDSIPEIYSIIGSSTKASINTFPVDTLSNLDIDSCFFNLGIKKGNTALLTISLNQFENIPENIDIILIDIQEQKQINLQEGSYEFSTLNIDDSRFQLAFIPNKIYVDAINITSDAIGDSIGVNNTLNFYSDVAPNYASNQTVIWSIDNSDIAFIDARTGLFSAIAEGTVTVTATSNDGSGIIATQTITVYNPTILVNAIIVSSETEVDSVEINGTLNMLAQISPTNASDQTFIWSVNNSDIATINPSTGLLSAKTSGIVEITATANDNSGVNSTISIVVYKPNILVNSILINSTSDSVETNSSLQFSATVLPVNANDQTFTWSVNNTDIATINKSTGLLSAKTTGTVEVTVTANGNSGIKSTYSIIVFQPNVVINSIALNSNTDSIEVNETLKITATVLPENASYQTITWSVNNTEIATINKSTGLLTAKNTGTVLITAEANDDSGVSSKLSIEVYQPTILLDSIIIIASSDSVEINNSMQLSANVFPDNASDQTYIWSVDSTEIASINSTTGTLTAKKTGTVIVTATANDNSEFSTSKTITVYQQQILADTITILTDIDSVEINGCIKLSARVMTENTTNQTFTWNIDNADIASIDALTGEICGKKEGVIIVTATCNDGSDKSDTVLIKVYKSVTLVSSIEIESENNVDSVLINNSIQLWANVIPSIASISTVTWKTDNPDNDIATINQTGLLTGKKAGTVKVTAFANDNSGVSGEFTINVYTITSIKNNVENIFVKLYPNPTNGKLILESTITNCNYKIYSSIGKTIKKAKFSNQTEIDLSHIENGTYFIEFTNNEKRQIELFIKN